MGEKSQALVERLQARTARAGVIGLGYVGLPLAVEFARAGLHVTGIDLDTRKVEALERGESYILDVAQADVASIVKDGRFRATTDFAALAEVDTINICVPTPLRKTKDPDLSYIVSAVERIADHLKSGQLVILESTTYPGTTDEVVQPMLEEKGLKAGTDFFLAFSPERVDPGNAQFHTTNIPKVVGGLNQDSIDAATALYLLIVKNVVPVSSTRAAEMVKLLENTFRAVNIGLVNELALMCRDMNIDVWEVIDAAKTKPFGFMPFYPGPGLGGHCIPIDPFYLSWKARQYRVREPLHRAGGPYQRRHAALRRGSRRRGAQLRRKADQGLEGAPVRDGVQAGCDRRAGVAGDRRRGAARAARRDRRYTDPFVPGHACRARTQGAAWRAG